RQGVSFIAIELRDEVNQAETDQVWSRIRDKADDARLEMPPNAMRPEFSKLEIKAHAMIVCLRWTNRDDAPMGILKRYAKNLKDQLDSIAGTEKSEIYGDPSEEVVVTIRPEAAAAMSLSADMISNLIQSSDTKTSAGKMRGLSNEMLLEVSGELDNLTRLAKVPIKLNDSGTVVELADIADIKKTFRTPLDSKVLAVDDPAVAIGVYVQADVRLDHWTRETERLLEDFQSILPPGISLETVFQQNRYVQMRMKSLQWSLLFGVFGVFIAVAILMGIRCATVVTLTLPLGSLIVLFAMYVLQIPIHQMAITGLIISMGLMIDNAIVIVDEIDRRLKDGMPRIKALSESVQFLKAPLIGSTITTMLSFAPIAIMPGPAGEFVGAIGTVTIIAVAASFFLALTIIASIGAFWLSGSQTHRSVRHAIISPEWLIGIYRLLLNQIFRYPKVSILLCLAVPFAGFVAFSRLPEQFFPPADRNQFHIELELSGTGSIQETELMAKRIREDLMADPDIDSISWFLGESAPPFYYNVIPDRKNISRYGQAIVDTRSGVRTRDIIRRVQTRLEERFPSVTCIVRQLEQGPPFSAPVEVQLFGPDDEMLKRLGEQIRLLLIQTPNVTHTRSEFVNSSPKVTFAVDEEQARLAGLDHSAIAREMSSLLEGVTGGSILEGTEELPVRVRISNERRSNLNEIVSMDLLGSTPANAAGNGPGGFRGVPLSAISTLTLNSETGTINRLNGVRINEIQAFIRAGILPSQVQAQFKTRLQESDFKLPAGYSLKYAGAEAERNDAIGNLIVNAVIIFTMMVSALVVAVRSFRLTLVLFLVAGLAVGCGLGSLWIVDLPWGFMSIVGIMAMIGIAVNDSIVVIAALDQLPDHQQADPLSITSCVVGNTRHIVATSLTTVAGFTPLFFAGGEFWPPVAVTISGGVLGATTLALVLVPCAFMLIRRKRAAHALQNIELM
ncbi:MAG TPA: acriflavine resistance protein B, partial [Planctomycetaceae bacterium]|nr:acriflavine resistance protein B [Planctomycetaceae bacterium]